MPMLIFYLLGILLSTWLAYRLFRNEWTFTTGVEMISGIGLLSWLAVTLLLIHIKLHYKWEVIRMYEHAIKQRALLLSKV